MASPATRNVTPIISRLRDICGMRKVQNHLRFEQKLSPRTQPPPTLPNGPSHQLANNYYHTRDGRRECVPDEVVFEIKAGNALTSGEGGEQAVVPAKRFTKPGFGYDWDTGSSAYSPK